MFRGASNAVRAFFRHEAEWDASNESALLGNSRKNRINRSSRPVSKHVSVRSELSHNSLSISAYGCGEVPYCDDMTVVSHDNEGQHRECFFGGWVSACTKIL